MKMMVVVAVLALSTATHAEMIKPIDKGQSMHFECQTGVSIHVVDDNNVVINGDFEAKVSELSEERLQAQGYHGNKKLTTLIDLTFMGRGYYSLLVTELDQTGSNGPWDDKFLGANAVICQRTK
ncbi:hypothetical protein [Scandinavium goeteborgense]|uniref:hypothetical protein n=1 Tax=Scandinavium goeteborgense TaxID=1851514 RepID=UPI001573E1D0|nr:hypothetical protein [Scandinavium goeteborgense]QKN82150.1 hypothetical protein A8O29_012960 [Scandinavium goeteborgense]